MPDSEFQVPGSDSTASQVKKAIPYAGTTAPSNPQIGQVWIDTGSSPTTVPTTVSQTAPVNPSIGDLWIDTNPTPKTTVGPTAPSNPAVNDIWIDTK